MVSFICHSGYKQLPTLKRRLKLLAYISVSAYSLAALLAKTQKNCRLNRDELDTAGHQLGDSDDSADTANLAHLTTLLAGR